jgi:hypothetical protein
VLGKEPERTRSPAPDLANAPFAVDETAPESVSVPPASAETWLISGSCPLAPEPARVTGPDQVELPEDAWSAPGPPGDAGMPLEPAMPAAPAPPIVSGRLYERGPERWSDPPAARETLVPNWLSRVATSVPAETVTAEFSAAV